MKANEAPYKLYIQLPSNKWIGRTWDETPIKEGDNPNWKNATNIEYTRTDVFIDKAVKHIDGLIEFLNEFGHQLKKERIIEDFKNYMKGE